jgi:hypothetical protein
MGHWWQACRKVNFDQNHYGIEYGANRIALAYWRTVDPTLMDTMMPAFESVLAHAPNPVPAGQNLEVYFNANYQELAQDRPTPGSNPTWLTRRPRKNLHRASPPFWRKQSRRCLPPATEIKTCPHGHTALRTIVLCVL